MSDTQYKTNAGSVFSLNDHRVWCQKYRRKVLEDHVAVRLNELLSTKANQLDVDIDELEIMPDHVHRLVSSDPTKAPHYLVNPFKGSTSRDLREEFAHLRNKAATLWSKSYDVGRVGHVPEETVRRSIETQEKHS